MSGFVMPDPTAPPYPPHQHQQGYQQPPYPPQNAPYPPQPSAFQIQNVPYPAQDAPWPAQQQQPYPSNPPHYPSHPTSYPSPAPAYPSHQYTGDPAPIPPSQPGYPAPPPPSYPNPGQEQHWQEEARHQEGVSAGKTRNRVGEAMQFGQTVMQSGLVGRKAQVRALNLNAVN